MSLNTTGFLVVLKKRGRKRLLRFKLAYAGRRTVSKTKVLLTDLSIRWIAAVKTPSVVAGVLLETASVKS